jgi:hypothetical protein
LKFLRINSIVREEWDLVGCHSHPDTVEEEARSRGFAPRAFAGFALVGGGFYLGFTYPTVGGPSRDEAC